MNKRGGLTIFYTLALGLIVIVLGMALAPAGKQVIDEAMVNLTCSSPASDYDQATCWFMDINKVVGGGLIILVGVGILLAQEWTGG